MSDDCAYKDIHAFMALLGAWAVFTTFFMIIARCCCKKKEENDPYKKDRNPYTEYMGRFPFVSFLFTAAILCCATGLAGFTPCLGIKTFTIDKNTENYIKSENEDTNQYDALMEAVTINDESHGWPYNKRKLSSGAVLPLHKEFLNIAVDVDGSMGGNTMIGGADHDLGRALSATSKNTKVTFVYMQRDRPSDVFTEANLRSIREFERGLVDLAEYEKWCRKESYYSRDFVNDDATCATQASTGTGEAKRRPYTTKAQ